jgi:arylsulfatase A-like enzyme
MRKTLTLFLLCLVWGKSKKPNVFLFIADDIGVTDISFASELYGEQQIRVETPHLDKIASKGQILSKFYVNNVGSTTRAALLTSTFSHKLGNPQITRHDLGSLEPNWRTFAHELVDRDYTTAHVTFFFWSQNAQSTKKQEFTLNDGSRTTIVQTCFFRC